VCFLGRLIQSSPDDTAERRVEHVIADALMIYQRNVDQQTASTTDS
jgi:hypothetical protein